MTGWKVLDTGRNTAPCLRSETKEKRRVRPKRIEKRIESVEWVETERTGE